MSFNDNIRGSLINKIKLLTDIKQGGRGGPELGCASITFKMYYLFISNYFLHFL